LPAQPRAYSGWTFSTVADVTDLPPCRFGPEMFVMTRKRIQTVSTVPVLGDASTFCSPGHSSGRQAYTGKHLSGAALRTTAKDLGRIANVELEPLIGLGSRALTECASADTEGLPTGLSTARQIGCW
jgi:hypothetical protein